MIFYIICYRLKVSLNPNANTNDSNYQLSRAIVRDFILLFCIFIQENESENKEYKQYEYKPIKCIFKNDCGNILHNNLQIFNCICQDLEEK